MTLHCRLPLVSLEDRGPLRVMFVLTSMPVGGAETLLAELIRRLDRSRFLPELCCLKELGPLGAELAKACPAHAGLLAAQIRFHRPVAAGAAAAAAADRRSRDRGRRATRCFGAGWPPGSPERR